MAPAVGFEPTTNRLTADRSTTELRWIVRRGGIYVAQTDSSGKWFFSCRSAVADPRLTARIDSQRTPRTPAYPLLAGRRTDCATAGGDTIRVVAANSNNLTIGQEGGVSSDARRDTG